MRPVEIYMNDMNKAIVRKYHMIYHRFGFY